MPDESSGYGSALDQLEKPGQLGGIAEKDADDWLKDHAPSGDGPFAERLANLEAPQRPYVLLQQEQARAAQEYEKRSLPEQAGEFAVRRMLPFASAQFGFTEKLDYKKALDRLGTGQASDFDVKQIATYQQVEKHEAEKSLPAAALGAIGHIPAIIGEGMAAGGIIRGGATAAFLPRFLGGRAIAAGGEAAIEGASRLTLGGAARGVAGWGARTAGQTALMPAMYLPQSAENAIRNGGEWDDVRTNLGPAAAIGAAQVGLLGLLSAAPGAVAAKFPESVAGRALSGPTVSAWAARMLAGTGTGMTGQEAIDTGAHLAGWKSNWGTMTELANGKEGALKQSVVQAIVFSVFSALHAHVDPNADVAKSQQAAMDRILQSTTDYLDAQAKAGYSRNAAGQEMLKIHLELGKQIRDGDFTGKLPENLSKAGREYSEKLASQMDAKGLAEEQAAKQNAPNAPESTPPASGQTPAEAETGAKAATPEPPAAGNARTPAEQAKTARDMATILEQQGQLAAAAKLRAEAEQLDPTPRQRWTREEQQQVAKGLKMNAREFADLDPKIKAQLEAEVIAKRAPKAAPAAHDFGDLKPDEVQFLRKQGMTDAGIAKLAGQAKAPAEPNPQREGLPVADRLFTEQFPGAKRHADGWYKATVGETDVFMEKGEAPNSVHLDFRDARGRAGGRTVEETAALNAKRALQGFKPIEQGIGESLRPETLKFLRPLREFLVKLKAEGKSVEYTAKGLGRQSRYAKALTKAGYEVVPELSDPDAPAPKFVWRPKAEVVEPNAQPAAQPPVAEADPFAALAQHGVEVRPEPPNPHREGLPPAEPPKAPEPAPEAPKVPRGTERTPEEWLNSLPPEQRADAEAALKSSRADQASESAPVRGRTEEGQAVVGVNSGLARPGVQKGEGDIPATIQDKIDAARLSSQDELIIEQAFKGNSLRATLEKLNAQQGRITTPEGVRKAQQRILRKLGSDAATVEEWMANEREAAKANMPRGATVETAAKPEPTDHWQTSYDQARAAGLGHKAAQEHANLLTNAQTARWETSDAERAARITDPVELQRLIAERQEHLNELDRTFSADEQASLRRESNPAASAPAEPPAVQDAAEGTAAAVPPPRPGSGGSAARGEPGPAGAAADAQPAGDVVADLHRRSGMAPSKSGLSAGEIDAAFAALSGKVSKPEAQKLANDFFGRERGFKTKADAIDAVRRQIMDRFVAQDRIEGINQPAKPQFSPDQLLLQQRAAAKAAAKAEADAAKAAEKAAAAEKRMSYPRQVQARAEREIAPGAGKWVGERAEDLLKSNVRDRAGVSEMLRDAREALDEHTSIHRQGKEAFERRAEDELPGLDEVAEDIALRHPGILDARDPEGDLLQRLKDGNPKAMTPNEAHDLAFRQIAEEHLARLDQETNDAARQALQSGERPGAVAAAIQGGEAEAKAEADAGRLAAGAEPVSEPEEAGRGDEPEHFDPAALDFDVDTLGKPAEPAANGRPVRGVGAERPDVSDATLETAEEFVKQEGGFVKPEAILARAYDLAARLGAAARFVQNNWREFAGNQFPRTARLSEGVAQKMAEWVHAKTAAIYGTPRYIDLVMGQLKAPAKTQLGRVADAIRGQQVPQVARRMAGAVETEWRLEYMHDAYLRKSRDLYAQADAILHAARAKGQAPGQRFAELTTRAREARDDAAGVGTLIGAQNSPLTSEAQYRAELAKPEHKDLQARWEEHMVPVMEANFRKAMGLDPADPIDSFTQRPGHPINLKNLGPNEAPTPSAVQSIPRGPTRGNLGNVRQGRLGFSRQAKGTGTYDIDLGAIIANSLGKGMAAAGRAEALTAMIDAEIAHPGEPFKAKEGFTEFQNTFPQKGNALAEEGQTSLYVKADAAGEYRQALQVDEAPKYPLIAGFNSVLTRANLASSVDAVYHGKNMLTFLMKPGVRLPDLLKNAYDVVRNTPEGQARLFELAKMGRMKPPGSEAGLLLGERFKSIDPTYHMHRTLDLVSKVVRLTAADAFDRMSGDKADAIAAAVKSITGKFPFEKGELNKTNFINQLGQYEKRSQNSLLVLLRDTGISPFATAGTNYYVQSMRGLTGASGARTTGLGGEVAARGEYFAKAAAVLGTVAAINYLAWGRADGDDKTPLGSIKVGETDGTQYLDLTSLTGLTRGARQTGLLAYAEGERAGGKKGKTTAEEDRAFNQIVSSLMHPFMGPGAQFLHTALTGHNSLGMDVRQPKMGDQSEMHRDVTAALWQANPAAETFRPDIQRALGVRVSEKDKEARKPAGQRAEKLFGPFGIRTRK